MEGLGSFAWLFEAGLDGYFTSLIIANDRFQGLNKVLRELVLVALPLALIVFSARVFRGQSLDRIIPMLITPVLGVFLMAEVQLQPEGRAAFTVTRGQWLIADPMIAIYRTLRSPFSTGEVNVNASVVEDVSARQAAPFAGSDLARLMRDYRKFCEPGSEDKTVSDEVWQAVGLRGGGGIGVPDAHLEIFSQETQDKAKEALVGWFPLPGMVAVFNAAHNAKNRRADGVKALREMGARWPVDGRFYELPTEASWVARFGSSADAASAPSGEGSYLDPRDVAGGVGVAEGVTYPDEIQPPFAPGDCLSAYQVLQAGAEAAYAGLSKTLRIADIDPKKKNDASVDGETTTGSKPLRPDDVAAKTQASVLDGIVGWGKVIDKSMMTMYQGEEGGVIGALRQAAGEAVGAKNEWDAQMARLDLVDELPRIVFATWFGIALITMFIPIVVVLSIFMGEGVLLYLLRLFAWGITTLFLIELTLDQVAQQFAGLQFMMAAQSIGMSGVTMDIAAQRGVLASKVSWIIGGSSMATGLLFQLHIPPSVGGSPGVLSKAATGAVNFVLKKATGGASEVAKEAGKKAKATKDAGAENGGGGGGSRGAAGTIERHSGGGGGGTSSGGSGGGKGSKSATDNYNAMQRRKSSMSAEAAKKSEISLTPKKNEE